MMLCGGTTCFDWFNQFKEGRTSVNDKEPSGRLLTNKTNEIVARVREINSNYRRITIRKVAKKVGISYSSHQEILIKE